MAHTGYTLIWPGFANKFGLTGQDLKRYVRTEYSREIQLFGMPQVHRFTADHEAVKEWETYVNRWSRAAGVKFMHPWRHLREERGFHGEWTVPEAAADTLAWCRDIARLLMLPRPRRSAVATQQLTLF